MAWFRDFLQGKVFQEKLKAALCLAQSFALVWSAAGLASAHPIQQQTERKPLGSLSVVGGVVVNDAPAQPGQTVFAGDILTTKDGASATFTVSGKGSFKIAPLSQVSFSENPRYVVELREGTVLVNTLTERSDLALRYADYVVMADPSAAQAVIMVKREADGSGLVSCVSGGAHILAIQGDTSLFLKAGQSTSISPEGQAVTATATPPPSPTFPSTPIHVVKKHWGWIVLGLAGAGGAAGAALAVSGGGGSSVSPSGP